MAQSSCIEAEVQVVGDCVSLLQFLDYDIYYLFQWEKNDTEIGNNGKLMGN
jgi:hypothetical protein